MGESIKTVCALGILCGAAMGLVPEGRVRDIMKILTTSVLLLAVLKPFAEFDFGIYAEEKALSAQREDELLRNAEVMEDTLNRLVIEQEYAAYIEDKASELGISLQSASVDVKWSTEGVWIPVGAKIECICPDQKRKQLCEVLEAELGVPAEMQEWSVSGE